MSHLRDGMLSLIVELLDVVASSQKANVVTEEDMLLHRDAAGDNVEQCVLYERRWMNRNTIPVAPDQWGSEADIIHNRGKKGTKQTQKKSPKFSFHAL